MRASRLRRQTLAQLDRVLRGAREIGVGVDQAERARRQVERAEPRQVAARWLVRDQTAGTVREWGSPP